MKLSKTVGNVPGVEQRIVLQGKELKLTGTVRASDEAFPCETNGAAQRKFPLIRTSHGLSGTCETTPFTTGDSIGSWNCPPTARPASSDERCPRRPGILAGCAGDKIELVFRPRYYQKHKNLKYFEPWNYRVAEKCVTGWCSWWAYRDGFNEEQYRELIKVWGEKHLPDFGYTVIQIDECYRGRL